MPAHNKGGRQCRWLENENFETVGTREKSAIIGPTAHASWTDTQTIADVHFSQSLSSPSARYPNMDPRCAVPILGQRVQTLPKVLVTTRSSWSTRSVSSAWEWVCGVGALDSGESGAPQVAPHIPGGDRLHCVSTVVCCR